MKIDIFSKIWYLISIKHVGSKNIWNWDTLQINFLFQFHITVTEQLMPKWHFMSKNDAKIKFCHGIQKYWVLKVVPLFFVYQNLFTRSKHLFKFKVYACLCYIKKEKLWYLLSWWGMWALSLFINYPITYFDKHNYSLIYVNNNTAVDNFRITVSEQEMR